MNKVHDVRETAKRLHCRPFSVYKLVAEQRLQAFRIGRAIKITESAIQAFIERGENRVEQSEPGPQKVA